MPFASAIRAIIVDDQLTSRALIRDGLQQLGIQDIEQAGDGEQGLKALLQKPAHLVISDLNMPKLDGLQFLPSGARASDDAKGGLHHADGSRRPRFDRACDQARGSTIIWSSRSPSPVLKGAIEAVFGKAQMTLLSAARRAEHTEERQQKVHIIQGQYYVSDDPNVVLMTLLGSCVAACIHDPVARVGGMNHFLLPGAGRNTNTREAERYGVHLMELLLNGLLQYGARKDRLQAKLFGGARTIERLSDIGHQIRFSPNDFSRLKA